MPRVYRSRQGRTTAANQVGVAAADEIDDYGLRQTVVLKSRA
jgi:hypothetical protein